MNLPVALSVIGLSLNMLGVVFAFVWGHPQPDHDTSIAIGMGEPSDDFLMSSGETYRVWLKRKRYRKAQYQVLSKASLGLMFVGFAIQIAALLVAN